MPLYVQESQEYILSQLDDNMGQQNEWTLNEWMHDQFRHAFILNSQPQSMEKQTRSRTQ